MPEVVDNKVQNQKNQVTEQKQQGRSITEQETLQAVEGVAFFQSGKYILDFNRWSPEIRDILKTIKEKKKNIRKNELERHREACVKYWVSSTQNHFKVCLSTAPFPNWFLNFGALHWQPDLIRVLLPPFFMSSVYDKVKMLAALKNDFQFWTVESEKISFGEGPTPSTWEKKRSQVSSQSYIRHVPSPILAEFLCIGPDKDVFPIIPVIIPLFRKIDLSAANKYQFALDLSGFLNPETQMLGRYVSGAPLVIKSVAQVLGEVFSGDLATIVEKALQAGVMVIGSVVDMATPGTGPWEAIRQTISRPETLLMIRGPLLWRGSEATDWSLEMSFVIPALLWVDLEGLSASASNEYQFWRHLHLLDEEMMYKIFGSGGRRYLLTLWTEAISRWFILPFKRYKQMQQFGWLCGFIAYIKDPSGRELYYWGIPDTWADISFITSTDGLAAPQEFTISVSGTSMVYGDYPDLIGLISGLSGKFFEYKRTI